jgi:hypothetical protein
MSFFVRAGRLIAAYLSPGKKDHTPLYGFDDIVSFFYEAGPLPIPPLWFGELAKAVFSRVTG